MRVLTVDGKRNVPVAEGKTGPELVWDEQPELPVGAVYLGEADGVPYAAVRGERSLTVNGRPVDAWAGLREVGADLGDLDAGLLVQAIGILEWHERNRFSPLTGAATTIERAGWVQRDPTTGTEVFPRTDPAVIMLVHDGAGRVVLGRQAVWPPGRFSILAGFVEPGESAEAAVAREVAEEVGLRVSDIRYVSSQPWPFPQSLMLGFVARADGDDTLRPGPRRDRGGPVVHPRGAACGGGAARPAAAGVDRPAHPRPLGRRRVRAELNRPASTRAGRSGWSARTTASASAAGSTSSS